MKVRATGPQARGTDGENRIDSIWLLLIQIDFMIILALIPNPTNSVMW